MISCCQGSFPLGVRPGTARILVTELSGSGRINPTSSTKPFADLDTEVESVLSPEKLKILCGTGNLAHVTSLEICVDTQENSLGNFGAYLPRLVQLRMNNSLIMSVRDLGTSLSHLQALWMSRCSLQELDGISSFSSLKELYVSYNEVSDLSQLGMLENLQLLDLEGNNVDDLVQVQYLELCGELHTLTLQGNPVCERPHPSATQEADYSYRAAVRELVPQLRYLDDVRVEEDGCNCSSTMGEEWTILRDAIRDSSASQAPLEDEETADGAYPYSRPASARRPATSSYVWPPSLAGSRPHTGSRPMSAARLGSPSHPGSRPGSADSDLSAVEAESSALTHGAGRILFCGNPVQALRARREKLRTAPTGPTFTPRDLRIHVPEHTYDMEEVDLRVRHDVFAELRAWREQHSSRLQAIRTEREAQVLVIRHSDEEKEEDDDDDKEEGIGSSDEDDEEEKGGDSPASVSPDSSLQSFSSVLHHREASSPDMARLSASPETSLFPSPPPSAAASTASRRPLGVRARRLRVGHTGPELLADLSRTRGSYDMDSTTGEPEQRLLQQTRTDVIHKPRPPKSSILAGSCTEMDSSSLRSGSKHLQSPQMSKPLHRPSITRPHTARAALQKHHPENVLWRKSSHPD